MAILEAAQFGKPCIGPDHGGFTEIIGKGESAIGRLFEPNNLNDLEKQVLTLWNQPVLTEELGRKAYEKPVSYTHLLMKCLKAYQIR